MFNTEIKDVKLDNSQEEENNRIYFSLWHNNQTSFETISSIKTNKDNYIINLNPEPADLNPGQNHLNSSTLSHHFENIEEGIPYENNPSLINKEDKIELIKKSPIINQNIRFTRKKRLRDSINTKINKCDKENQEKQVKLVYYNRQLENTGILESSSYRFKRRKNNLGDPCISNMDQKRFRYKIRKKRNIRIFPQNSEFSSLGKDIKREKIKDYKTRKLGKKLQLI